MRSPVHTPHVAGETRPRRHHNSASGIRVRPLQWSRTLESACGSWSTSVRLAQWASTRSSNNSTTHNIESPKSSVKQKHSRIPLEKYDETCWFETGSQDIGWQTPSPICDGFSMNKRHPLHTIKILFESLNVLYAHGNLFRGELISECLHVRLSPEY